MLLMCAANSHHPSPESGLFPGEVDPGDKSAEVSRWAGDEVLRWKGIKSIETICIGRLFFSARGSCSDEE